MTPEEIAWTAGLFEGEGYVILTVNKKKRYVSIGLNMTDRDVVERFQSLTRSGGVWNRKPTGFGSKPVYWCRATGNNALVLLRLWWPYLGKRRRQRALQVADLAGRELWPQACGCACAGCLSGSDYWHCYGDRGKCCA